MPAPSNWPKPRNSSNWPCAVPTTAFGIGTSRRASVTFPQRFLELLGHSANDADLPQRFTALTERLHPEDAASTLDALQIHFGNLRAPSTSPAGSVLARATGSGSGFRPDTRSAPPTVMCAAWPVRFLIFRI